MVYESVLIFLFSIWEENFWLQKQKRIKQKGADSSRPVKGAAAATSDTGLGHLGEMPSSGRKA